MGLLDLHADSIERNALTAASNPGAAPEPTFSTWAATSSFVKGVPAGLLEGFGAVRDFSNAVDRRHADEDAAFRKRYGLDPKSYYIEPNNGAQARAKADEFMPDPLTAHYSQQVAAGFSKSLTKAGTAMAVAGPTGGAALFGLAEADDVAQRLQDKGIDSGTAWQVGGVVGTLSAIGARLPVSGAALATTTAGKVAATTALGVAGGPLSYMAQEGLSREILQKAGHADEAALHDPMNPIGLAASLFPLVLGGFAVRANIKAEKVRQNRALLQAELDKQTKAAAAEVRGTAAMRAAEHPEAVDAARVAVVDETLARSLPDTPGAHAEMLRAADMVGAGDLVEVMTPAPWEIPRTLADVAPAHMMADELRGMAQGAYWAQEGGRLVRTGIDEAGDGGMGGAVAGRTPWVPADEWFGRMRSQLGKDGLASQEDIAAAVEKAVGGQKLRAVEARTIDWMRTEVDEMRMQAMRRGFEESDAHALAQEGFNHGLGKADAEDLSITARAAQIDEGAVERAAMQYENDDAGFMAEMQRIIANGQEAAPQQAQQPIAGTGARSIGGRQASEAAGNTLPEADQVGLTRPAPEKAETAGNPDAALAQKLVEQNPDMPVRLPGDETNTTLAAAMERIQAEQQADDQGADLYQVAVSCFLTGGAAT